MSHVKADRQVNVRGNMQSENDAVHLTPDGAGLMIKLMIDGMDQSKFRVPRNLVTLHTIIIIFIITTVAIMMATIIISTAAIIMAAVIISMAASTL